jgi:hypothetical protein
MRVLISHLLAASWLALLGAPAIGAEFTILPDVYADVTLEGKIELGDYDKLLRLIVEINSDCGDYIYVHCAGSIYLASPGGSLIEAMKIGQLVRALRWETMVPSPITNPYVRPERIFENFQLKDPKANHMCASACFFIFVAGTYRSSDGVDVDENVILGIHRPYLTDSELRSQSGDQAITSANRVRDVVEGYLKEMGVPSRYADMMFSIPKDEVRWIDRVDFHADFNGDIPELKDWIDARCNKLTNAEKAFSKAIENKSRSQLTEAEKPIWDMLVPKVEAQVKCELHLREKLKKDAWAEMSKPKETWTSWWWRIWKGK